MPVKRKREIENAYGFVANSVHVSWRAGRMFGCFTTELGGGQKDLAFEGNPRCYYTPPFIVYDRGHGYRMDIWIFGLPIARPRSVKR
jgi:hypothetical protein